MCARHLFFLVPCRNTLCGLTELDTVLAIEYSFFSKTEGGVLKLDCMTANCVLPVMFLDTSAVIVYIKISSDLLYDHVLALPLVFPELIH